MSDADLPTCNCGHALDEHAMEGLRSCEDADCPCTEYDDEDLEREDARDPGEWGGN